MVERAVERTQYWDDPRAQTAVRDGSPALAETFADVEQYLLPMERRRLAALHDWGVADGLRVTASPGAAGVQVGVGTAFNADGRQIVVAEGGSVIVDPNVDPDQIESVPTVTAQSDGVQVDTTAMPAGDHLLTITWREVLGDNDFVNARTWLHAPWLRLTSPTGFSDVGQEVVLARLTVDADGKVVDGGLTAGSRRVVGALSGRLLLRAPAGAAAGEHPLSVHHEAVAELAPGAGDDVVLTLLGGSGPRPALIVEQASGAVRVAGALSVAGTLTAADVSVATLAVSGALDAGDVSSLQLLRRQPVGGRPGRGRRSHCREHCERDPGCVGHLSRPATSPPPTSRSPDGCGPAGG